jgi:hypothetical protein
MSTYVYNQAWEAERERLRALEELHDEATTGRLAALGVGEGWRCLEVGCGAGAETQSLSIEPGDALSRQGLASTPSARRWPPGSVHSGIDAPSPNRHACRCSYCLE